MRIFLLRNCVIRNTLVSVSTTSTKLAHATPEWRAIQIEVPPSLWPYVKATAAEKNLQVREYVTEVLSAAVVAHRSNRNTEVQK